MQLSGIILGLATFLCIGVFHPIVIKCEYRFSYRIWPVFLAGGLVFLVLSALVEQIVVSSILGVIGFPVFGAFWNSLSSTSAWSAAGSRQTPGIMVRPRQRARATRQALPGVRKTYRPRRIETPGKRQSEKRNSPPVAGGLSDFKLCLSKNGFFCAEIRFLPKNRF